MADLAPGTVLAERFEVVGTLGRGGMATVYLARDTVRDEQVAVKVLHDHLAHDPSMRRRLKREVQAASLVRHEAALVAHDLHPVGESLALSMPFHGGTTLAEHVRAHGPLDEAGLRALGARVAGALADAHRQGVLHRDVTPNNVMLDRPDDAVLTDFGLARSVDERTATATSVMGTPGYAAPETYHGQRTDPRSDLYGLGAVLYFAATGRSPYGSGAPAQILAAQLAGDPAPLGTLRGDLPADLRATIASLLARDPELRPPGADEVARALQARRAAMVPEVPDTWDAAEEPVFPGAAAPALAPTELPSGVWEVVLEGRRGCDARTLADHVGRVFDLPDGALEVTAPMRTRKKKFLLTRGTDRATAERLAEAGRVAGYKARLYDGSPPTQLESLAKALPLLIPIVWVAFPFVTVPLLGGELALFLSITFTLLVSFSGGLLGKARPDDDLPLALTGDIARHVVQATPGQEQDLDAWIDGLGLPAFLQSVAHEVASDVDIRTFAQNLRQGFTGSTRKATPTPEAKPAPRPTPAAPPEPEPAPTPTRAEGLRARALGHLDLLVASLEQVGDALPDVARADLARTAASLRERAVELGRSAVGLEAALASTPEPEDVSWIQGRLTRMETLARTGTPVDEDERARLLATLQSAEDAASARDELEARLTSTLAQLLEIGALATRARADLHGQADVPATASDLRGQLEQQVEAVDAMRREMGRRSQAAQKARQR